LDPLGDDSLSVGDGFLVGGSFGHAVGEFRDFDEEGCQLVRRESWKMQIKCGGYGLAV
jgi:hypothetical protein